MNIFKKKVIMVIFSLLFLLLNTHIVFGAGNAIRNLSNCYAPSVGVSVSIVITPSVEIQVYAVEDAPPSGWAVGSINENGQWDNVNKKVKWGLYFDHNARTLTYQVTPPVGETGTKTFSGTASFDGTNATIGGGLTIGGCPVANNQSMITSKNIPKAITLTATDTDGDPLTYSIVTGPSHGVLSGPPPNVTYTPSLDYTGSDSFTFKANDGKANSNVATVSIMVLVLVIYPAEGTIGTELIITGSNFGTKIGKVLIGRNPLKVLEWTNESIRGRLTKVLTPGTYNVTIQRKGKGAAPIVEQDGFTVKAPKIVSLNANHSLTGDQIAINGRFFGTKKGRVYLGYESKGKPTKKSCKVLSWTMDPTTNEGEIVFAVPKGLSPEIYDLIVTNGVGSGTKPVIFTID